MDLPTPLVLLRPEPAPVDDEIRSGPVVRGLVGVPEHHDRLAVHRPAEVLPRTLAAMAPQGSDLVSLARHPPSPPPAPRLRGSGSPPARCRSAAPGSSRYRRP